MDIERIEPLGGERSFNLVAYVMRFIQRDGPVDEDRDIEEDAVPVISAFDRRDAFHTVDFHNIIDVELEIFLVEAVTQCENRILAYFEAGPYDQYAQYECEYGVGDGKADLCKDQADPRTDAHHAVGQVIDCGRLERTALRLFGKSVVVEVDHHHDESTDEADPQSQGVRCS